MSQALPVRRERAPVRLDPLSELERVRRMLDETMGGFGLPAPMQEGATAVWSPPVDIEELEDAYVIEANLPGVRREDVNVEVIGNELTISGEIAEREHRGSVRRQSRQTGRFEYRVALPVPIDADKVEAKLADGVLTVRVPKSQPAQRRRVELKSS